MPKLFRQTVPQCWTGGGKRVVIELVAPNYLALHRSSLLLVSWNIILTKEEDTDVFFSGFRALQEKLDQPISAPSSPSMRPRSSHTGDAGDDVASNLVQNIQTLKAEVSRLQSQLRTAQTERELYHSVVLVHCHR